jgi:hypothetical protein
VIDALCSAKSIISSSDVQSIRFDDLRTAQIVQVCMTCRRMRPVRLRDCLQRLICLRDDIGKTPVRDRYEANGSPSPATGCVRGARRRPHLVSGRQLMANGAACSRTIAAKLPQGIERVNHKSGVPGNSNPHGRALRSPNVNSPLY